MTEVPFESAMESLSSMFRGVDNEVILMILQSNHYRMEPTIEQLLTMTGNDGSRSDATISAVGRSPPSSSSHTPDANSTVSSGVASQLPDDFLRPPSYFRSKSRSGRSLSNASQSQIDQDAILAQMLQDELFLQELRNNPDLYQLNDSGRPSGSPSLSPSSYPGNYPISSSFSLSPGASSLQVPQNSQSSRGDFTGLGSPANAETLSFRDKWNSLTGAARQRLLAVAAKLKLSEAPSRRKGKGDLGSALMDDTNAIELDTRREFSPINDDGIDGQQVYRNEEAGDASIVNDEPLYEDDRRSNTGYVPPHATMGFTASPAHQLSKQEKKKLKTGYVASDL